MTDTASLLARRARVLGPNVPTFYNDPVHLVRGEGVWLWDADGQRYLDCYNNVPHIGHCHPAVVDAITAQAARLNTHTRYLHETVLEYVEALTARFEHGLSQAIMVCTGSEANDIALRMAEAVTGKIGLIATDNTYHGNTKAVSQLSARRPPIGGYPAHVRLVPSPDRLVPLGGDRAGQADAFAAHVARAAAELEAEGHGFAGLILCPCFANEGLPCLEPGFLAPVAQAVKAAGGLLIADEVQPGFGRLGSWWGHQGAGIAPDIVTLGKPMANGHPVGAVVTRPDVMAAFREALGYFNTFGGNPVSAAAALTTLQVVEREGLVEHAAEIGRYTLDALRSLDHPAIADIRGEGQFYAIELMGTDGPASALAIEIVEEMRRRHVLIGKIGRAHHILKMRPPMPFGRAEADLLVETLSAAFRTVPA